MIEFSYFSVFCFACPIPTDEEISYYVTKVDDQALRDFMRRSQMTILPKYICSILYEYVAQVEENGS